MQVEARREGAEDQNPEIHSEHFLHGYPADAPATNDLVIRDSYALSSNDDTKSPNRGMKSDHGPH